MPGIYHQGNRTLQDEFDSRRLADRLNELIIHDTITDEDKAFIESLNMFFIRNNDEEGSPPVSYKGGDPGFIKVLDHQFKGHADLVQQPQAAHRAGLRKMMQTDHTSGSNPTINAPAVTCAPLTTFTDRI